MAKKGSGSTALVRYDEEFAALAAAAVQQEGNAGGGSFISTANSTMSVNGAPVPGNRIAVLIADSVLVNALYEGAYDADSKTPPVCYAIGRDEATLAPHKEAPKPQAKRCAECPNNEFGSAEKGNGKACRNLRRLAVISAGTVDDKDTFTLHDDTEAFEKGERLYLSVPPTSINGYAAYVKQLAGTLKIPPAGMVTLITVIPDKKVQMRITFKPLVRIPEELKPIALLRHKAERDVIEFPFPKAEATEKPARPVKKAGRRF